MRVRTLLAILLLTIALGSLVFAQEITGTLRGSVTDPSGAVVPNATVTVTNTDKGIIIRKLHSDQNGGWVAPLLPIGHYSVAVEAPGFKVFNKTSIVLNASDRLVVDSSLSAGANTESVTVQADVQQVNLQNAAQEGLIDGVQVRELPLNNRNYEQLVNLQPGVTSNAADSLYVGTTSPQGGVNIVSFSINGNRQSQNNWTVDGADNVDHGSNITLLVYPSIDAIAEFKIERSNYSPEFGRSASGQINVVTRSGGAGFHGSAYEFFRNDALNANQYLNKRSQLESGLPNTPAVLRYNDFGATIGGPIWIPRVYNEKKQKTFFFVSEEMRRVRTPVTEVSNVPTPSMLAGNFATPVCTAVNATGTCTAVGTSISPANFNPVSTAYLQDVFSKIPGLNPTGVLTSVYPGVFNYQEEIARLDHVVNSRLTLMGRFINDHIPTKEPFGIFGPQSTVPGVANTSTNSPGRQWMGRATMQLTNNTFNEIGYAYSFGAIVSNPTGTIAASNSPDVVSAINLPYQVSLNRIPNVGFATLSSFYGFGEYLDYSRNHNVFDNFSWTIGKHSTKWGFQFNHYQKRENAAGNNAGDFEFDNTCNGALCPTTSAASDQEFANFLLGYSSAGFSQSQNDLTADMRQNLYEFYGQDEFRIASNLTLTYGLRYSYFPTPTAASKNLVGFDPALYNPANAPQITASGAIVPGTGTGNNGLIIGGQNSPYGDYITRQDKTNFAPRLGIAWDPFKTGKTSVRAGYGFFYDSVAAGLIEDNVFNNAPFVGDTSFSSTSFFTNVGTPDAASTLPPSLWTTDPRWTSPYTQSWNLDIQQEFGKGWIADVGYVGNTGTHLPGVIDINQVKPGVAQAAGLVAPGAKYSGSVGAGEALNAYRPFVGFMQIGQISPRFTSNYHALQTSLVKHFGGVGSIGLNYTWSKGLTTMQTDRSTGIFYTYCVQCDYGRSQLDRRNVFTANYVYDLPWYRNQEGLVGHLLGGYEISGIVTANSGLPFTVLGNATAVGDPMASGYRAPGPPNNGRVASARPIQASNPNSGAPHTFDEWFNTSAFANPTIGGTLAGLERRGAVNGPGFWRYDMSLMKNTSITERVNLQFRAEAFNLFNHVNYQSIGTTQGSSTFGQVTAVRDPRILQLALKVVF
jgi:Carboxypeptidase regulatory-like domain/TonB dependent receptor